MDSSKSIADHHLLELIRQGIFPQLSALPDSPHSTTHPRLRLGIAARHKRHYFMLACGRSFGSVSSGTRNGGDADGSARRAHQPSKDCAVVARMEASSSSTVWRTGMQI